MFPHFSQICIISSLYFFSRLDIVPNPKYVSFVFLLMVVYKPLKAPDAISIFTYITSLNQSHSHTLDLHLVGQLFQYLPFHSWTPEIHLGGWPLWCLPTYPPTLDCCLPLLDLGCQSPPTSWPWYCCGSLATLSISRTLGCTGLTLMG